MRKLLLIAGIAALTIPGVASAQTNCVHQRQDNRVAGRQLPGAPVASAGGLSGAAMGNAATGAATSCAAYSGGGYYDVNGVWRQGPGFYDADGHWVDTAPAPAVGDFTADVAYAGPAWDTAARETWLQSRIHEGETSGALSPGDAAHDFGVLAGIRRFEAQRDNAHVGLTSADRADVLDRLADLTATVRSQWAY